MSNCRCLTVFNSFISQLVVLNFTRCACPTYQPPHFKTFSLANKKKKPKPQNPKNKKPKGKRAKNQGLGNPGEPETVEPVALSRPPPATVRRPRPPKRRRSRSRRAGRHGNCLILN
jgi:hypothetical protein